MKKYLTFTLLFHSKVEALGRGLTLIFQNAQICRYWDLVWSAPGSTGTTGIFDVYASDPPLYLNKIKTKF